MTLMEKAEEVTMEMYRLRRDLEAVTSELIAFRKVAEYFLGEYVLHHTGEECRKEAFERGSRVPNDL